MKYDKKCWFCGRETMFPIDNYYQCSECGATQTELPKPAAEGLVREPVSKSMHDTKYRPVKRRGSTLTKRKR